MRKHVAAFDVLYSFNYKFFSMENLFKFINQINLKILIVWENCGKLKIVLCKQFKNEIVLKEKFPLGFRYLKS